MPTKFICFDHAGKQIQAEVYYNLEEFSDAILISPIAIEDLNDIIFYSTFNKKWETKSPVKEKFPSTVKNIVNCIKELFEITEKGRLGVK